MAAIIGPLALPQPRLEGSEGSLAYALTRRRGGKPRKGDSMRSARGARHLRWKVGSALAATLAVGFLTPAGASAGSSLSVHGSVNQVYLTGGQPGSFVRLLDRHRKRVSARQVGTLGGVVFR